MRRFIATLLLSLSAVVFTAAPSLANNWASGCPNGFDLVGQVTVQNVLYNVCAGLQPDASPIFIVLPA